MSSQTQENLGRIIARTYVKRIEGQIGLRRQRVRLIFDKEEIRTAIVDDCESMDWYENCHGAYLPQLDAVYLNLSSHRNLGKLKITICHELVHRRFPDLEHGEVFDRRVQQVYKGRRFRWILLVKRDKS